MTRRGANLAGHLGEQSNDQAAMTVARERCIQWCAPNVGMKPRFHFYPEEIDPYTAVIVSANKGIAALN
jgi:hypothetical protein